MQCGSWDEKPVSAAERTELEMLARGVSAARDLGAGECPQRLNPSDAMVLLSAVRGVTVTCLSARRAADCGEHLFRLPHPVRPEYPKVLRSCSACALCGKQTGMYFVQAAAAELRADEGEGVQHVSEL